MKKIYHPGIISICIVFFVNLVHGQGTWEKVTDHPEGKGVYAGNANIAEDKVYFVFGAHEDFSISKSMWVYDLSEKSWSQKASFPDIARYGASSFTINDSIYYISGSRGGRPYLNEFWAYSIKGDNWVQKPYPAGVRLHATSFTINNKGYIFGGRDSGPSGYVESNTLWEYNPDSGTWTQKASIPDPNSARFTASAFVMNGKAYIVGGKSGDSHYFNDTWEYDPIKDVWTQKAARSGKASFCSTGVGFSLNRENTPKGYYGLGINPNATLSTIYEYDQASNTWDTISDFPNKARATSIAFVYKNQAYVGLGQSEYKPIPPSVLEKDIFKLTLQETVYTDTFYIKGKVHQGTKFLASGLVTAFNVSLGKSFYTYTDHYGEFVLDSLPQGQYQVKADPRHGEPYDPTYYPNITDSLLAFSFKSGASYTDVDIYMHSSKTDTDPAENISSCIIIAPSPFSNYLSVSTNNAAYFFSKIQIYNLIGSLSEEIILDKPASHCGINTADIKPGMYVIKVETPLGILLKKIIK